MPIQEHVFRLLGEVRGMEQVDRATKRATVNMKQLAFHAAAIIPTWAVLRTTILALPRAISAATKEWMTFQTEMSRVATVTRGSQKSLDILERSIRNYAITSKASFKDTASAVYALGSAGLSVAGQLGGLEHVMNVAIGTGGNVEMTAKLMAGAVNVFGKSLDNATTEAEQFKKIGDTIAYTYSTQQIELSELATALGYVASVGSLVDIKFNELVATIGVLNTGMLKGSKSGTSLVNAFIQLANKSERLGKIGINIDTSKPLNFLNVMEELHRTFGGAQLSLEGLSKIMSVFGIRGGRAVGLLLTNFNFFKETLDKTKASSEDFAEIMKRVAEENIPAVAIKIKNSFSGIWMDVLDQWETPFLNFLKTIQNALDDFRTREAKKRFFGETTTVEGVAKAVPQLGAATGAFLLGRSLPGIQKMFPQDALVEARATELAQMEANKRYGTVRQDETTGQFRKLTDTEKAINLRKSGIRTKDFRSQAAEEAGIRTQPLAALGSTLAVVAKYAIMGYAGLKLIQSGLNTFAPNNIHVINFNKFLENIETGFLKLVISLTTLAENLVTLNDYLTKKMPVVHATGLTGPLGFALATATKYPDAAKAGLKLNPVSIGEDLATKGKKTAISLYDTVATVIDPLDKLSITANDLVSYWAKAGSILNKANVNIQNSLAMGGLTVGVGNYLGEGAKNTVADLQHILISKEIADRETQRRINNSFDVFKQLKPVLDKANVKFDTGQGTNSLLQTIKDRMEREKAEQNPQVQYLASFEGKLDKLDSAYEAAVKAAGPKPVSQAIQDKYASDLVKTMQSLNEGITEFIQQNPQYEPKQEQLRDEFGTTPFVGSLTKEEQSKLAADRQIMRGLKKAAQAEADSRKPKSEEALLKEFNAKLDSIYSKANLEQLKLFDSSADKIAIQELAIEVEKLNAVSDTGLTISDFMVQNAEKLNAARLTNKAIEDDILKLQEKGLEILTKQQKEILKSGEFARDAFKDIFTDAFDKQDFSTITQNLGSSLNEGLRENYADILGDALTDVTGVDSMFGNFIKNLRDTQKGLTNPIAKAHLDGITRGADLIRQAHVDGMSGKSSSGSTYSGTATTLFGGEAVLKRLFDTPIFGGKKSVYGKDGELMGTRTSIGSVYDENGNLRGTRKTYVGGGRTSIYGTDGALMGVRRSIGATMSSVYGADGQLMGVRSTTMGAGINNEYSTTAQIVAATRASQAKSGTGWGSNLTYGKAAAGIGAGIAGGSMAYESAGGSDGGAWATTAGVLGAAGAAGLAITGTGAAFAGGAAAAGGLGSMAGLAGGLSAIPVAGWVALAAVAAAAAIGIFNKPEPPTQRTEEVREQTQQLASRIDITNNSLSWVNRNLIELRQELTYIMKDSYYFSQKSEAERFAIDSSRGNL